MKRESNSPFKVSSGQVAAFRLARHRLTFPQDDDLIAVCRDICGVQAQLMPAAKIAIGVRTTGVAPAHIEAALWSERTLVKALCMRQTVHFLPTDEFSLYMTAVKKSRVAAVVRIMARFGITARDTEKLNRATLDALQEGPLTLRELTGRIRPRMNKRVRAWMDRVWNAARLALVEGLICYGPDRGPQVTFVRVEQWLPSQRCFSEAEAQQLLLRKFLRGYGPAAIQDFSHWSGIPVGEARIVWEDAADEFAAVSIAGQSAWLLKRDLAALRDSRMRGTLVNLLPAFDSFLLAHAEKDHLVAPRFYKRVFRSLGQIAPVVLVNGQIAGTWTLQVKRKERTVLIAAFGTVSRAMRRSIERETARLGKFLGSPCWVSFAPR